MKRVIKTTFIISIVLLQFLIWSCKKEKPVPPTITTATVTEVSYTTAVSGGNVTDEGSEPVSTRGICYNTSPNPTTSNNILSDNGSLGAFTSNLMQLNPNTVYYVRAYATNISGTAYGRQESFKTSQQETPVMTTTDVTAITQTTAIAGGNITDDNGALVTARGVCWSTSQNPATSDNKTEDGTGTGSFVSSITGLSANTTYFVRSYSINSVGTAYGNELSFKSSPGLPVIITSDISGITTNSSIGGGTITSDGGVTITEYGMVWSTLQNPTTADNKIAISGSFTGVFTSSMNSLDLNTLYYVRAYATNSIGTQYGNQVSFTTDPLNIADVDGNVYNVVRLGTQLWMSENLKTTKYKDGTDIPLETDNTQWGNYSQGYCWYDNDEGNKNTLGALYNWYTVSTGNLCPEGWHVPTNTEWIALEDYLLTNGFNFDGTLTDYKIAKSLASTTSWNISSVTGAVGNTDFPLKRNVTGFTALSGGFRALNGTFYSKGNSAIWWSSSESNADYIHNRSMEYNESKIGRTLSQRRIGCSVRCLRD